MKKSVMMSNGIESKEVKIGLSWPGFFFSSFWSLYKGMWGYTFIIWLVSLSIAFLTGMDTEMVLISNNLWGLIWSFYFLFRGNQLVINRLLKLGWKVTHRFENTSDSTFKLSEANS